MCEIWVHLNKVGDLECGGCNKIMMGHVVSIFVICYVIMVFALYYHHESFDSIVVTYPTSYLGKVGYVSKNVLCGLL